MLAEEDSAAVRRVSLPVVEHPTGGYDLIAVLVRTHQVDAVLESQVGVDGDVLFLLNWAAGPEPLRAVIGLERMVLGFPTDGGTMDGDVVRYRASSFVTRRVAMPISEADGRTTPRLERLVRAFRTAGINATFEPQMDAWLKAHAAFEVPLGQAVHATGGPVALADDPDAIRDAPPHAAEPGRDAEPAGPARIRCVAGSARGTARGHLAALLAGPDGRTFRAQQ